MQSKRIGHGAVVSIGPEVPVVARIDQLNINQHSIARSADTAFKHIRHAQGLANLADIAPARCLKSHHARVADYFQLANLSQTRQHIVLDAGSEISVFLVITQILERQHGNAFLR